jgi:hypothetical protein
MMIRHVASKVVQKVALTAVLGACTALGGCATIVHSGPRTIPVASTPSGAKVSIYDRSNVMVSTNTTPFMATLPTKYRYFKGQSYRLVFELPGHTAAEVKLESSMSGWYLGNLLFGGIIGMLIVDPLTGAMYNLSPEKIEQSLSPAHAKVIQDGEGLMVILTSEATPGELAAMVRVN